MPPPRTLRHLFLAGGILSAALPMRVDAQGEPREGEAHLFVGVRLFVPYEGDMAAVQKMDGKVMVVETREGSRHEVDQASGFSWQMHPKVSRSQLSIAGFKADRAYSPQNDPRRSWVGRQTSLMNYQMDQRNLAENSLRTMESRMAAADQAANNPYNTQPQSFAESSAGIQQATLAAVASAEQGMAMAGDNSMFQNMAEDELAQAQHDAIQLDFEISSPEPIAEAYAVVISRIKTKNRLSDVTFQHNLGALGPRPRKVSILQGGLPLGYELVENHVYIFNHGEEIATNLSEKQFNLSAADAYRYLLLDHVANHRHETVPAQPVWSLAPPELTSAVDPARFDVSLTVDIDAEGQLVAIHDTDQIVTDAIRALVRELTFLPALENGQPAPGTIGLNLADYFKTL